MPKYTLAWISFTSILVIVFRHSEVLLIDTKGVRYTNNCEYMLVFVKLNDISKEFFYVVANEIGLPNKFLDVPINQE